MVNGFSVLYVPVPGVVNAARFRYAVGPPVPYGSSSTCTARCPPRPVSAVSTPVVTLDRLPDCHRMIADNCQSPSSTGSLRFENVGARYKADIPPTWRQP